MPDQLKAGIESLSGMDLSSVRVHRNSDKPAQLNALAYAQGTEIHLGPAQERHLPHEAWHVVQQMQGRVPASRRIGTVAINDDPSLESEADHMGSAALQARTADGPRRTATAVHNPVAQRAIGFEFEATKWQSRHRDVSHSDLQKGEKINRGIGYWLTADQTQDRSDLEFVTDPLDTETAVTTTMEQITAMAEALTTAQKKAPGTWLPLNAEVEAQTTNDLEFNAHVQVTVGVPLEHLPALYDTFASHMGGADHPHLRGRRRHKDAMAGKGVRPPPSTLNAAALSGPLQGFALVVIDTLAQGMIPVAYRNQDATVFPKALFPVMTRTRIEAMFAALPQADQDLLSYQSYGGWGRRLMRQEWIDWFVHAAVGQYERQSTGWFDSGGYDATGKATPEYLKKERLVTASFGNQSQINVTRADWLREIPNTDMLADERDMFGLGELGNKTDQLVEPKGGQWAAHVPRKAPVFELRNLFDYNGDRTKWMGFALDAWQRYHQAVGQYRYRSTVDPTKLLEKD